MGRKAVDVVLLPDGAMTAIAIEANSELVKKSEGFKREMLTKQNGYCLVGKKEVEPDLKFSRWCVAISAKNYA